MNLDSVKVLCWKCRGAGNQNFSRNLHDLLHVRKPQILAILEPRISGRVAEKVCIKIGWENWYRVEADCFSGGLWIFWRTGLGDVKIIHEHHQFIHLSVSSSFIPMWFLTVVYASPNSSQRQILWRDIR